MEPVYNVLRKIAKRLAQSSDYGHPYENISIFGPSNTPSELGGYGHPSETEQDDDEKSKWQNDMRRQGPYPPDRDSLIQPSSPTTTVFPEMPNVGETSEGPKTDAQGLKTHNTPIDTEIGMDDPTDLNGEIQVPTTLENNYGVK